MKLPVFILAAALLSACGGRPVSQVNVLHEAHNAMSQDTLTANMGALRGSRQWGTAGMGDAKHAYIARGNCTPPSSRPWRELHPVAGGKSKTYVAGPDIGRIKAGRYSSGARSSSPLPRKSSIL